jgi:hypothetical protein
VWQPSAWEGFNQIDPLGPVWEGSGSSEYGSGSYSFARAASAQEPVFFFSKPFVKNSSLFFYLV